MTVSEAMVDAESKAWDALARYKFWMFGYHAAQWVLLNRVSPSRTANPFKKLVQAARDHVCAPPEQESETKDD